MGWVLGGGRLWGITMNNAIYGNIVVPIWIMLFVFAICFLFCAVYKTIHGCNRFLEVSCYEITNG